MKQVIAFRRGFDHTPCDNENVGRSTFSHLIATHQYRVIKPLGERFILDESIGNQ